MDITNLKIQKYQNWIDIQKAIFSNNIPKHYEWSDITSIIIVLNKICSIQGAHYMFYPTGGGQSLKSANLYYDNNCIELDTGFSVDIIKPKCLSFESFDNPIWNYFRLDLEKLEQSNTYPNKLLNSQEKVVEINSGNYIPIEYWDIDEYDGDPLPEGSRILIRHLCGSFVFFARFSPYNHERKTDDGRHNNMTASEFRQYIENAIKNGF